MTDSDKVARALADRLTDEQEDACRPDPHNRIECGAHSIGVVRYNLGPSGRCRYWLDHQWSNTLAVRGLLDDEAARDILMEYWDV